MRKRVDVPQKSPSDDGRPDVRASAHAPSFSQRPPRWARVPTGQLSRPCPRGGRPPQVEARCSQAPLPPRWGGSGPLSPPMAPPRAEPQDGREAVGGQHVRSTSEPLPALRPWRVGAGMRGVKALSSPAEETHAWLCSVRLFPLLTDHGGSACWPRRSLGPWCRPWTLKQTRVGLCGRRHGFRWATLGLPRLCLSGVKAPSRRWGALTPWPGELPPLLLPLWAGALPRRLVSHPMWGDPWEGPRAPRRKPRARRPSRPCLGGPPLLHPPLSFQPVMRSPEDQTVLRG